MKKRLFLAFAGFALFSGAMAQSSGVGLRLGGNYSTLSGYEDFEPSSKILPSMGLTGFLQGKGNWSFSADLLFSQRGVEYKKVKSDSLQTETELYDETLNYIEIPVLFHYSFLSDSSAFRPRVFFGPRLQHCAVLRYFQRRVQKLRFSRRLREKFPGSFLRSVARILYIVLD